MKHLIVWGLLVLVHASDQALTVGFQSGFQAPASSASGGVVTYSTVQHPTAAVGTVATPSSAVQVPGFIRYVDGSGVERLVSFTYPKPFYQHVNYQVQGAAGTAAGAGVGVGVGTVGGSGTKATSSFSGSSVSYPVHGSSVGSTTFYKNESPELIRAREEHFRTWALQQYHALRREIDVLRLQRKEPSADMLEKYRPLERIATTVDYQAIANYPDVQRIRNEHLRLWNEAALKTLQHPFTGTFPVVYQPTKSNVHTELDQQKLAHEAHLRVYNEQISLLKQLEAKRIQDLHHVFGVATPTVTPATIASTAANVVSAGNAQQQLKNALAQQHTVPVYVTTGHQQHSQGQQQQPGFALVGVHPDGQIAQVKSNIFGVTPVPTFQKTVINPFNVKSAFPVQSLVNPADVVQATSAQFHHTQTVPVSGVSVYSGDGVQESHPQHQYFVQSVVPQHSPLVGQQVKYLVPTSVSSQSNVVHHHQQQQQLPAQQQHHQPGQQNFQQKAFQVVVPSGGVNVHTHQHAHAQAVTPAVSVHRGVAVLKSLQPVGIQYRQQQQQQQHHQQQHHLNSLQDTPEVAHARAEHLRIYNEIKSHTSLQDQAKASVLKDGSSVQRTAGEILEKFNENERRRHEQQSLEVERIREAERVQEEKIQRERERAREADRLAEEQRQMETELWRLKEEEKKRQEVEKRNEFHQLRKQENEVRQQQQQHHHFNAVTVKGVGGVAGGPSSVVVNAAGVEGAQHLRTTAGLHHVDPFQSQHQQQQAAGSSTAFYVVPLAGADNVEQAGGTVSVHGHRSIAAKSPGSPNLTVVPTGGVVVTSTEHPGKSSTTLQDLEQATREHFRAHEVALEQLRLVALKDGGEQNTHQHEVNAKDCE